VTSVWLGAVFRHPPLTDAHGLVSELTAALLERRCETAPHVVAKLARRLNYDRRTVCEVAALLTPAQRRGHRVLPRVLPVTPSIIDVFEPIEWEPDELFLLLLAALSTVDQIDLLLEASGSSAESIVSGSLGAHLKVENGRFEFVDRRLCVWVLRTADAGEIARAHESLQRAHHARQERVHAEWHRARGALLRTPEVVSPLLAEARSLSDHGHSEWGSLIAAEAADHAAAGDQEQARLIAGAAMMAAGCLKDGADWLGSLFPHGTRAHRAEALASVFIAEACLNGALPVLDPAEHRPRSDDAVHWHTWARTAGLAASLCAERGAHSDMRMWLTELREADARAGVDGAIRDPVVALCWMLTNEAESSELVSSGPISAGVIGALRAALDGDIAEGLQILSRARTGLVDEADLLVAGFENSPMVDAYLVVTEVLLLFWRGDLESARARMLSAVVELPMGLPFAGLGSTLAHRLDIAVIGAPGALSRALAKTLPGGIRVDRLVDQAIGAYLAGESEHAVRMLTLWTDRDAPEHPLAVPGLDEVGPINDTAHAEPPELALARTLRRRLRLLKETSWQREHADVAAAARSLQSPFERARVEAMLGIASVIRGERVAGVQHLQSARTLFDDAGAHAWGRAVEGRVREIGEQTTRNTEALSLRTVSVAPDPLAASRSAWTPLLTARELDVAMRVIEGLPNSEIADALAISVRTVEVHTGRIFGKLGVRNRVQLMVLANRTARHM